MLCKAIMSLSISLSTKLRECLACKKKRGGISLETIIFSLFLWYCSWYVYLHLVLTKKMLFTSSEKGPNSWMADMGFSKYTMIMSGRSSAEEDNQFWTCNGLEKKVNHAQFAIAVKDWNHQVMKKILYMLFLSLPLSLPFDHSLVFILLPSTPLYISLPSFSCPFPSCNRKKKSITIKYGDLPVWFARRWVHSCDMEKSCWHKFRQWRHRTQASNRQMKFYPVDVQSKLKNGYAM